MNKFVFEGRVTKKEEIRYGQEGKKFTELTVNGGNNVTLSFACFGHNAFTAGSLGTGDNVICAGKLSSKFHEKTSKHYMRLDLSPENGLTKTATKDTTPPNLNEPDSYEDIPF